MSQNQSTSSQSERPDECPECGSDLYYEPRCEHGTRYEATSGWACPDCHWYTIDPSSGVEPSIAENRIDLQQFGTHSTEDDGFDEESMIFQLEESCPDCGGTLEFYLRAIDESRVTEPNQPKYAAAARQCLEEECQHRVP
jgi:rRNA maturation protein Nop10